MAERLHAEVTDADAAAVREELAGFLRELQAEGQLRGIDADCDFGAWADRLMDRPGFFEPDGSGWRCEVPASCMRFRVPHLLDGYVGRGER